MNLAACGRLPREPLTGVWYRAIELTFVDRSLSTDHTPTRVSRFSRGPESSPPFELLFLCDNTLVALFEAGAMFGDPLEPGQSFPHPHRAWTLVNVSVALHSVIDLTRESAQRRLKFSAQELTGDWRGYHRRGPGMAVHEPIGPAPTQELGEALFALPGLEGFLTLSAKLAHHRNLVIFPEKLQPGSHLVFEHPASGRRQVVAPRPASRRRSRG